MKKGILSHRTFLFNVRKDKFFFMKKFFQCLIYLLTILLINEISFGQDKKNIAVIDLSTRGGLSQSEVGVLTDRLRSMLVSTNVFNVVERGKMEAILQEVGFQQSGCTSTECAVEVGKILNVQQMVTGSIGKLGATYTLDISVIDVATSKIVKSLTRNYKGEIDGLLELMGEIANQLAETSQPEAPKVTEKPKVPKKAEKEVEPPTEGRSNTWLWIGGGTILAVGGVAAAVLLSKKSEPQQQPTELPSPEKIWPPTSK
jgi:hypothetical protein